MSRITLPQSDTLLVLLKLLEHATHVVLISQYEETVSPLIPKDSDLIAQNNLIFGSRALYISYRDLSKLSFSKNFDEVFHEDDNYSFKFGNMKRISVPMPIVYNALPDTLTDDGIPPDLIEL